MEQDRFFKGWAKPGPEVPGKNVFLMPETDESLDALSGCFRIFQLKDGHRFSTDDLLVAWYGTQACPCPARVLDLGSGIGSVGMTAAWKLPGSTFVTVEAQQVSIALARKSVRYNGLEERYLPLQGDFRDPAVLAGQAPFDLILGSPPYFPLDAGMLAEHPQKVACRFETRGDISDYCKTAASHLNWGGTFACIFPIQPHQLERVREAARESGLSIVRWRPVVLKEGEPPLLGVFGMMRSDHLPETFREMSFQEPDLIIRRRDGTIHPEYSVIKLAIGFPP